MADDCDEGQWIKFTIKYDTVEVSWKFHVTVEKEKIQRVEKSVEKISAKSFCQVKWLCILDLAGLYLTHWHWNTISLRNVHTHKCKSVKALICGFRWLDFGSFKISKICNEHR